MDFDLDFVASFLKAFQSYIPKVVNQLEVGLGPAGEMRYPGYQLQYWNFPGVGEFQCYDLYMTTQLKDTANAAGHPEWGVPPNNAGNYNSAPEQTGFFSPSLALNDTCDATKRQDCGYVGINQQQ